MAAILAQAVEDKGCLDMAAILVEAARKGSPHNVVPPGHEGVPSCYNLSLK